MAGKHAAVVFLATAVLLAFATRGVSRTLRHVSRQATEFNPNPLCKNETKYSKVCEKVANNAPGGIHVTDEKTLVEANVAAAITKAEKAKGQVDKLMKTTSETYQGIMGSALEACKESYDSALDALKQSQTLLQAIKGNHDDLMTQLSAASTFVTTCQDSLDEVPEISYPPQTVHQLLDKLVANSLDLGAHLN